MLNKLPSESKLIASQKFGSTDCWEFSALLKLIEEEVQAREQLSACNTHESRRPKEYPNGAALFMKVSSPQCCFCQQSHSSKGCHSIAGVESRRQALRKSGRCFICLGRGHMARNGSSRIKCLSCMGRHHVAICPSQSRSTAGSQTSVLSLSLSMLEHHPSILHRAKPHGLTQVNMFFSKLHKLLHLIPTVPPRHREFES